MNKIAKIIYTAIFVFICCVPLISMPFFYSSENDETIGKEERQEMPDIISDDGINQNFGNDFNLWFTQSLAFRPEIITAKNKFDSGILMKKSNNVIVGKEGWLFTEESVNDYCGITVSKREIHNIARTIFLMQAYCNENGVNFIFAAAPNKNTIYPEYMPLGYIKGKTSNLDLLEKEIQNMGINYADLKNMLIGHKENGEMLFLKNDTHWNYLAALYSYNEIMRGLEKEHKTYSGENFEIRNDWLGDLSKMLYPSFPVSCEQYYFDINYGSYRFVKPRNSMSNDLLMETLMGDSEKIDTVIQTRNSNEKGSVYISRDSFFRSMLPFIVDNYKSTYITRYRDFDLRNINLSGYTDVIYEMVERKLDSITDSTPNIYANKIEKINGIAVRNDKKNIIKTEITENGIKIYGILDKENIKDDSNIYVVLSNDNEETFYEAFPITEKSKLGLYEKSDYGFSALIDISADNLEKNTISVIIG